MRIERLVPYKNHKLDEEFFDNLIESGNLVYEVEWDADNLGSGWGSEYVYSSSKGYFVYSETEWWLGPFETVQQALEITELNFLTGALINVNSTELSDEELKTILVSPLEEGFLFKLNGNPWTVNGRGKVEPVPQEK